MPNTIKSEEFYILMLTYRHSQALYPDHVAQAYQAVIAYIDKDRAERDKRIVAATVEACKNECETTIMFEGGRQESYAHNTVHEAAKAIGKITHESVLADIDKPEEGRT